MRIIVCVKQVPSTGEVRMNPSTNTIIRDASHSVINPFDAHAVEAAVCLREKLGGSVTALSMGIPATEQILRDTVARGADTGVLLSDRAFAGADTLATSLTLSAGVAAIGAFDLILCGKMAVDGDTAQIGPELAEALQIPHVTDVNAILAADEKRLKVRQATGNGFRILEVRLPALITVTREINLPRMPSLAGIRRSLEAPFSLLDHRQVDIDPAQAGLEGSPTQVIRTYVPPKDRVCIKVEGDAAKQAQELLKLMEEVMA